MTKNLIKAFFGKAALSALLPLVLLVSATTAFAQSAEIRSAGVYYKSTAAGTAEGLNGIYCNWPNSDLTDTEYKGAYVPTVGGDPWKTSALIEYDQPYPSASATNNYPNHCLSLCFDVYCTNRPTAQSTYSIAFPLQQIQFLISRYNGSKDITNIETNPPVRTVMMSIRDNQIVVDEDPASMTTLSVNEFMCGSYHCYKADPDPDKTYLCPSPQYFCDSENNTGRCYDWSNNYVGPVSTVCTTANKTTNCIIFDNNGAKFGQPMRFCTGWDGAWEIDGEFGKVNGQYGFMGKVHTDFPGDGQAIEKITVDDKFLYPGDAQYPIQVDVTNVHTVRTSPTVMGAVDVVGATPYIIRYRLSKDADVKMQIFDASAAEYVSGSAAAADTIILSSSAPVRNLIDWQPRIGEGFLGGNNDKPVAESEAWDGRDDSGRLLPANNYLVSIQAKSQDEWPGTDFSRAVTRQISLDPLKLTDISVQGLSKQSTAFATVNYVPTYDSTVYFEVYSPGTIFESDFTRGYEPTSARPYIKNDSGYIIYSNHQQRANGKSYPEKWDGLCHAFKSEGTPDDCPVIYSLGQKLPLTGKFLKDASNCTEANGTWTAGTKTCKITYGHGSPMPDGNYVYVLWAEVPYTEPYFNGAACYQKDPTISAGLCSGTIACTENANHPGMYDTCTVSGIGSDRVCSTDGVDISSKGAGLVGNAAVCRGSFTGVKTQRYYIDTLPVERGLVDISIQPVSYSTVGSSPTAYGLDPFIFKYAVAREAIANAYVKNTAGVTVKTLTTGDGTHNTVVAKQMNTLTWDGRDDRGRMVGPGTYMFVVEVSDPMFPNAAKSTASALFPVDLYRVTDLETTDVYGDSDAKATISYSLSKAMSVQIDIYNKDVVIPNLQGLPQSATTTATSLQRGKVTVVVGGVSYTNKQGLYTDRAVSYKDGADTLVWTATEPTPGNFTVTLSIVNTWPPRVCNLTDDAAYFGGSAGKRYVNPSTNPKCIYVNDLDFTDYPANAQAAKYNYTEGANQTLNVRLQPIKTFNRNSVHPGDGLKWTEEWDAQYFYNPTSDKAKCTSKTDITTCPYEMVPDGQYPFSVAAQTNEPMDIYYDTVTAAPVRDAQQVLAQTGLYSTDKWTYRINITRGPVYFLDGSVSVYPNAPQLFNTSSGPIFVPPYEINFAISRAATVEVAIVALQDNMCTSTRSTFTVINDKWAYNNKAGDVCRYLSTMTIPNSANFDPNIVRKLYWDGTDNNGKFVRNGNYEIRLIAKNYPDAGLYQPTVKQLTQNIDLLKVFDLPENEAYAINKRGTDMKISYQVSVPMKVAIQIFKPGTTIFDYQKGTLRDPSTGKEVKDIHDVLVRTIVGIRPATTLIEELWDGTDYAQQGVPDGTYPFRFVTALNSADIDTITGEVLAGKDKDGTPAGQRKIDFVADTNQYVTLHDATVAIGDGTLVCEDWEKTVFFYPNPFKSAQGTLEVTKMPVPGKMSIKLYNLAGDLIREKGFECIDAQNLKITMGTTLEVSPDNAPKLHDKTAQPMSDKDYAQYKSVRNAALRCFWDKTNDHGKKVARGVYFGLVDFRAQNGRQHCQKVVKILIPR